MGCPQREEQQLLQLGVLGIVPRPAACFVLPVCVLSRHPPRCLTEANTGAQGELKKADLRKWQRILLDR